METINRLFSITHGLVQEYGREPTEEELATAMQTSTKRVSQIIKAAHRPISLETPVREEEDSNLLSSFIEDKGLPQPADAATSELLKEQLQDVLASLSAKERRVIELRFGLGNGRSRTLDEVGQEFGLTRERVRQIQKRALDKLRHPKRSQKLRGYLG